VSKADRSILALVLALEAVVYCGFFYRELAWFPPDFSDQAVYLSRAYELQDALGTIGPRAVWAALNQAHPNGLVYPIAGGLLSTLLGGGRLPALLVNFIGFAVAQVAVFLTVRSSTRSRAFGYVALGLVLLERTTWNLIGGLFDFRMDFVAFCLYGTWTALALRSAVFRSLGWSALAGAVAGFLLLHRFVAIVHVLGVTAGLMGLFAVMALRKYPLEVGVRARNLAISTAAALAIFLPAFWPNWPAFRSYYALTGEDPTVRAAMAGVFTIADSIVFYPHAIALGHLGPDFIYASIALVAVLSIARLLHREREESARRDLVLPALFLLGAVGWPVLALTLHPSKASQTAGIVGIPLAILVALVANAVAPRSRGWARAAAVVVLALAALFQLDQAVRHSIPVLQNRKELRDWSTLVRWLNAYAIERRVASPVISVDVISSRISAPAITSGGFEMTRVFVRWRGLLGASIASIGREQALAWLKFSDVIVLSTVSRADPYSFHVSVKAFWPDLKDWTERNMTLAGQFEFGEESVWVYVKPERPPIGFSRSNDPLQHAPSQPASLQRFPSAMGSTRP
jgi:hypothetical protein